MNYLITFRTYGTWLHGDERGSVDREHNQVGEPVLGENVHLKTYRRRVTKSEALLLDEACRKCVEATLREVAAHRNWSIVAINVLSNHVHAVVSTDDDTPAKKVLNDFKTYATRRLREQNLIPPEAPVWSRHGSIRYLNFAESVQPACDYVLHQQDNEPRA